MPLDNTTQCETIPDAINKTIPCVFPFKLNGKIVNECLPLLEDKFWCSTKVNEEQEHISGEGHWGICSEKCPTSKNNTIITSNEQDALFSDKRTAWKGNSNTKKS